MTKTLKYFSKVAFSLMLLFLVTGFQSEKKHSDINNVSETTAEGKAYWFISYLVDKKMYVSSVFNNDCNHCNNEIMAAYKKFLVMNDYLSNPNTANMLTYHDISLESLNERRDEQIYKRKQQGYTVTNVNFTYSE